MAKTMASPGRTMIQKSIHFVSLLTLVSFSAHAQTPRSDMEFEVKGLQEEVEILVDRWGVSHIYAKNERDLFIKLPILLASSPLILASNPCQVKLESVDSGIRVVR